MATATKYTTNGLASVTITYDFDWAWVTMRSVSTGNELTLDLAGKGIDSRRFTGTWDDLWHVLQNTDNGATIGLTADQMKTFKAMCEFTPRINAAKGESRTASGDVVANERKRAGVSTVNGVENAAGKVEGMRRVIENVQSDTYVLLQYDIPESSPFANPSSILWRNGFRMTKSVWVLPSRRVASPYVQCLLNEWKVYNESDDRLETKDQKRVKYRVLPFAQETMAEIKQMAVEALDEYVRELHTSLIERIASADERLKAAHAKLDEFEKAGNEVTEKERTNLEWARMNQVRAMLREKGKELDSSLECAELFDATESVDDLLKGLRSAIAASVDDFNEKASQMGVKLV